MTSKILPIKMISNDKQESLPKNSSAFNMLCRWRCVLRKSQAWNNIHYENILAQASLIICSYLGKHHNHCAVLRFNVWISRNLNQHPSNLLFQETSSCMATDVSTKFNLWHNCFFSKLWHTWYLMEGIVHVPISFTTLVVLLNFTYPLKKIDFS